METRHPVDGQVGREFPAICNHCGVTAWSLKTWKFLTNFCVFLDKRHLLVKFLKFCRECLHGDTRLTLLCLNVVFFRREIGEIVCYLPVKKKQKFGCRSNCRYCADRAQNLPQPALTFGSHCFRFHPNRFTFGGVIAERAKAVLCPIAYFYDRLFEPITNE